MKKILLSLTLVSLFFILYRSAPVSADDTLPTQTWKCLTPKKLNDDHRVQLTGSGFPGPGNYKDGVFIVGCAQLGNWECTTGNSVFDQTLALQSDPRYTFVVDGGAKKTPDASGNISAFAKSETQKDTTNHVFFGVTIDENINSIGHNTTPQQGTLDFNNLVKSVCINIHWDPKGRVFDSQSLDPLPNVQISLLNSTKALVVIPGINNPSDPTGLDGGFNFYVNTGGTFYFNPTLPAHYMFTANPNLNANYSLIYKQIYKPDEAIIEAVGKTEHRDIPLDPGTFPPYHAVLLAKDINCCSVQQLGNSTQFTGTSPYPFTIFIATQNGQEIARGQSDNLGNLQLAVQNRIISPLFPVVFQYIKPDLTQKIQSALPNPVRNIVNRILSFIIPEVYAATQTVVQGTSVNPVIPYLEGYAYDRSGKAMPNATVAIKLDMSGKTYYQTTADATGYFKVMPQFLPLFSYYLEFTAPNSLNPITYTTVGFAASNKDYFAAQNINLMTMTKNNQPIFPPATSSGQLNSQPNTSGFAQTKLGGSPGQQVPGGSTNGTQGQTNPLSSLLIIIIILTLLIAGVGGIIGLYLYRKNKNKTQMPLQ